VEAFFGHLCGRKQQVGSVVSVLISRVCVSVYVNGLSRFYTKGGDVCRCK